MTLTTDKADSETAVARPSFAWRGVALVSGSAALVLSVSAARLHIAGDELYYLACGRRLAVSYVDNGPLVPLIARLCDLLAPGSVIALRIPGLLLLVAVSILAAAVAYECGARPRFQMLAAAAFPTSPLVFGFTVLTSVSFDIACQASIIWLLVRWVRTRRDRLLVAIGVVAAIDVQDKWLVLMVAAAVGLSILTLGPREILRRPALWLGLLIFAAAMLPALLWQASHDWPQLATNDAIAHETAQTMGGQWGTLGAIIISPGFIGGGLILLGMYGLVRAPHLRQYRFLLVAAVLMVIMVIAGHGRSYYVAGIFPVLFGVGASMLSTLFDADSRIMLRRLCTGVAACSAALLAFLACLPYPSSWIVDPKSPWLPLQHYGNDTWHSLADAVHEVSIRLPPAEQATTVVVASAYNQAGALDHYGQSRWIPPVYSPHRGFAAFGTPPDSATTIVYVGFNHGTEQRDFLAGFAHTTKARQLRDPLGLSGQNFDIDIWICRDPLTPMSTAWPSLGYTVAPPTELSPLSGLN
ncbi:ArnT family glycosyltransferase [Nocardia sp. NPDC058640]|uniref:ArnT family glycosyltransferase n=1 Tax=Nocardia sp. NPDC058640 TaxID=3346571 RepID=UPI00364665C0